jgi:hypothetical protein
MSDAINPKTMKVEGHRPTIGLCMKVGSPFARTMNRQDWWITTPVLEIIEDAGDRVKFKTRNSVYEWRA